MKTVEVYDYRVPAYEAIGTDHESSMAHYYEYGAAVDKFFIDGDDEFHPVSEFRSVVLAAIATFEFDRVIAIGIGNGFDYSFRLGESMIEHDHPTVRGDEPISVFTVQLDDDGAVVDHDLPECLPAMPAAAKVEVTIEGENLAFVRSVLNGDAAVSDDLREFVCSTFGPLLEKQESTSV